jgi:hypothetical protein
MLWQDDAFQCAAMPLCANVTSSIGGASRTYPPPQEKAPVADLLRSSFALAPYWLGTVIALDFCAQCAHS